MTLKEIKKRVVPALDDELAKDLGEFDSLDALRAHVRHDLEHEAMHAAERQLRQDVMKQLATRRAVRRCRNRWSSARSIGGSRISRGA